MVNHVNLSIKAMIFFWKMGLVDTFTLIQFLFNAGAQYRTIVMGAAAGNSSEISPMVLLEPIRGLGTAWQYINIDKTGKRMRISTVAAYLAMFASAVSADPASNAAVAGAVLAKIAHMRTVIETRGGSTEAVKYVLINSLKKFAIKTHPVVTPLLTPTQIKF